MLMDRLKVLWDKHGWVGFEGITVVESCVCFQFTWDFKTQNTAEIQAIHKACEICVNNHMIQSAVVSIVSDSMTFVSWVNGIDTLAKKGSNNEGDFLILGGRCLVSGGWLCVGMVCGNEVCGRLWFLRWWYFFCVITISPLFGCSSVF
ncbi:hypothetical protein Ddye_024392 [Dipteronia dyeriana]|uniref:Uncharacterized protein n=1 Tax=Dipteronia dyeriana TaxID=168575 RepID=A0AAD9WSX5_9ROSI|nr:hypothetical protein Ddye_024392 [Dipteronia dyeriana]